MKKITEKKKIALLFWLCFLVYFSTYLGRLNYSASLSEMIRAEGFGKGQAGLIGTLFFASYGAGQLISGFLGDKLPCKWLVFCGMFISGILNGLMSIWSDPTALAITWCINGLSQAFIWSPMIRILYDFLEDEDRARSCLRMNFSVPVGTMAAYGLTAVLIQIAGWRSAFRIPAVWIIAVAFIWLAGISRVEKYAGVTKEEKAAPKTLNCHTEEKEKSQERTDENNRSWKAILTASGLCFLLAALCVQGALKDGVTTWIPTYLEETHHLGSMAAILSTMLIPICNLFGVSLASLVDSKWGRNEVKTSGLFFGICSVSLLLLLLWGDSSVLLALLMLAVCTTAMMAVNTMLIAVLPSRFGKLGKASSVSGLLNSCVYVGGATSTYGIGALSAAVGWNKTILLWILCAVVALLLCALVYRKWKKYVQNVLK